MNHWVYVIAQEGNEFGGVRVTCPWSQSQLVTMQGSELGDVCL